MTSECREPASSHLVPRQRPVALVLAAGRGTRFAAAGGGDKLLASLEPDGTATVLDRALQNLQDSVAEVFVAVRPESHAVIETIRQRGAIDLSCPCADDGMGSVLAWAVGHLPADRAVLVALGDMPFVHPDTVARLVSAAPGAAIVLPVHGGRRGHPVRFAPALRAALAALHGESGARAVLAAYPVIEVDVDDPGVLRDVDTPADLSAVGA